MPILLSIARHRCVGQCKCEITSWSDVTSKTPRREFKPAREAHVRAVKLTSRAREQTHGCIISDPIWGNLLFSRRIRGILDSRKRVLLTHLEDPQGTSTLHHAAYTSRSSLNCPIPLFCRQKYIYELMFYMVFLLKMYIYILFIYNIIFGSRWLFLLYY